MRKAIWAAACALATATAFVHEIGLAQSQKYPTRPITIIVPWTPGASNDLSARALGAEMSKVLGQTIVVENIPGAAGSRGSSIGARADPDGYTLTFGNTTSHATNVVSLPNLSYHPIRDFEPISLVHRSTMTVTVNKDSGIHNLDELIAYLKANPETAFSTPGIGTPQHMIGELLSKELGIQLTHIPYKGGAPAVNDLMAGHVKLSTVGLSNVLAHHRNGDLRILAVTSDTRHPDLPEIPALAERFPNIVVSGWGSLHAPKGTDPAILEILRDAVHKALATKEVSATLITAGLEPAPSSGEELVEQIESDITAWQALVAQGVELQSK